MANPNLANINQYFSRTTTTLADIGARRNFLENARDSNSLIKINSLLAYNSNTANTGSLTISLYDYSGNITSNIFNVTLAPQSNTVTLIDRTNELFLEEGDSLSVSSNISNTISVITSFDTLRENNFDIPYEYLVVAGGAAGGVGIGGGGGAGGLLCGTLSVSSNLCYSVVVGAGGSAPNSSSLTGCGSNSFICTSAAGNILLAIGGGGGGGTNTIPGHDAYPGGSGGGTGIYTTCAVAAGIPGQGFPGGLMNTPGGPWPATGSGGGGGGGANQTGESPPSQTGPGGYGGNGCLLSITGVATYYAGGGGGGGIVTSTPNRPAGIGGCGGGGPGGPPNSNGCPGCTNSGGGGGGGNSMPSGTSCLGGTGGSGIVILRHPSDYNTANTTGTVSVIANVAGYVIYCFTGSGTITPR